MTAQKHNKIGIIAPHITKIGQNDMHIMHKMGLYTQIVMQQNGKIEQQQQNIQHI